VYIGNGSGGFTLADANLPGAKPQLSVALGDVNDDGIDDLAYINSSGAVLVYTWVGPNTWQSLSSGLPTGGFERVQIADMNCDGHGDVLAVQFGNPGHTRVYTGNGAGGWTLATTITHPNYSAVAAFRAGTDFDHNGYPDFVVVGKEDHNRPRAYAESSVPTDFSVFPKFPRGGETFVAGSVRFIDWHAGVPAGGGLPTMTIELSRIGPEGPFCLVAAGVPNNGRYQWQIPATLVASTNCYLRLTLNAAPPVVAVTPAPFTIISASALLPGDLNCDGHVNFGDINPFVLILSDRDEWQATYPCCPAGNGDINADGGVNFGDINPFVALLATQ
jgi:hypothetical protein